MFYQPQEHGDPEGIWRAGLISGSQMACPVTGSGWLGKALRGPLPPSPRPSPVGASPLLPPGLRDPSLQLHLRLPRNAS